MTQLTRSKRAALAGVLAITALAACAPQRTEANAWACKFGSGPFDTRDLKNVLSPGSEDGWGNDTLVKVPSDVRYYIIDSDPATADSGGRPIVVPARGSASEGVGVVQASVEVQVRFVFNERACEWYIKHGKRNEPLRYDASAQEPSGWQTFLNTSMNQKLIEAARPVVAPLSYIDAFVNAEVEGERIFTRLATETADNLTRELNADLGGTYFCGPSYVFDGDADGEIAEGGCPDMEVTVKRIAPTEPALIANLEKIVNNEEAIRVIESDKERRLREIAREQEEALADTARQQETQTADAARRQAVETANAEANLAIEQAQAAVEAQKLENQRLIAEAGNAAAIQLCIELAAVGVDCALYEAGRSGTYPPYNFGDGGSDPTLLLPAPGN